MIDLDRPLVVAHRARVQGLCGDAGLDVLAIGVPDAPSGSADLALAVRTGDPRAGEAGDLVRVLSIRGAPHVHRRPDLPRLRAELRPRRPEDLLAWLGGHGPAFVDSGVDALAVVEQVADLIVSEFPGERASKGELSGAISPLLPEPARPWCAGCGVHHVIEGLFRLGTLLAGAELERGDRKLIFRRPDGKPGREPKPSGHLVREGTRLTGPVRADDLRTWLAAGSIPLGRKWEPPGWADLEPKLDAVRVDGATLLMWPGAVDATGAELPPVQLLPPRDPYLLGNRSLVVPDKEIATRVWRAQVSPGVLLVDGEVRGVWRQRISGRTITLHLTHFGKPRKGLRRQVADRAELVAAVRGAGALHPQVVWED
jgi:hypothetical protein